MEAKLKMVYWKGKKFWVGKLVDHPEVMTPGKNTKGAGREYYRRL